MERVSVDLGQFVLTGNRCCNGKWLQIAATVPIGSSQPVLYVEFRKTELRSESSPWWATSEGEKGSRMMRKTFLVFLGAAAVAALTLFAVQPRTASRAWSANAAGSADTIASSTCSATCFERVRTDYVEKPDDGKLVESGDQRHAAGLDPIRAT